MFFIRVKKRMNDVRSMTDSDALQLEVPASQKLSGANKGARREILREIGPIDVVEFVVQTEVRTKDLDGNQIIHRQIGGGESGLNSIEQKTDFFFDVVRCLGGLRIN